LLLGWCCSCYLYGQNAEQIDGSDKIKSCVLFACCAPCSVIWHKPLRETLRKAYNLEEKPSDFIATCICCTCGNCQEARELKLRGMLRIISCSKFPF
jgi:Cys-rich protein (TIGR01571 family)